MSFEVIVFYLFAGLTLASAFLVIVVRNPVHAALSLILCFFSSAGLWLLLEAEFLAIVLVLVYVGAVMVLFLFIIMLLDVDKEENYEYLKHKFAFFARFLGFSLMFFLIINSF